MPSQPALFCPARYSADFATLEYIDADWCYKIVFWQCGRPMGHIWYATIYEAVLAIISQGWQWASEAMKQLFETDIILATGE